MAADAPHADAPDAPAPDAPADGAPDDDAASAETEAMRTLYDLLQTRDPEQVVRFVRLLKQQLRRMARLRRRVQAQGHRSLDDAFDQLDRLRAQVRRVRHANRVLLDAYRDAPAQGAQGLHTQGLHDLYDALHRDMEAVYDALDVTGRAGALRAVARLKEEVETFRAEHEHLQEIQDALDLSATPAEMAHLIEQMTAQLDTLYAEKQRLAAAGFDDADNAVDMIESMHAQLQALYAEQDEADQLRRLADARPDADVPPLPDDAPSLMQLLRDLNAEDDAPPAADAPEADRRAPVVVDDPATLARLEGMTADELDALPFGAVALGDDEVVRFANAYRPPLPGLDADDARDAPFFRTVTPAADTPLFRGRFRRGVRAGTMDARFRYAFVTPRHPEPLAFAIHLHRKPGESINWILYRALDEGA
jgi:photoactive yellow protein